MEKQYANAHGYTDITPYEVVRRISDKTIEVRAMDCERTPGSIKAMKDSFVPGGFLGHFDNDLQEWTITSNEDNPTVRARRHKDGYYHCGGKRFLLSDKPRKFYDYNF